MAEMLLAAKFVRLKEDDRWQLEPETGYFVTRNGSSLIALRTGSSSPDEQGLRLIGAHTDST
jgi:aspartyl aminopeptidase